MSLADIVHLVQYICLNSLGRNGGNRELRNHSVKFRIQESIFKYV